MKWAWHVACLGEKCIHNRVLVSKFEGRRPLGRSGVGEDALRMGINETRMEWINPVHGSDQ